MVTFDEAAEAAQAISGGIIGAAELRGAMAEFSLATDKAAEAMAEIGLSPTTPDPQEEARSLLRQIVIRNGPAGVATTDALRQLGFSDNEIAAMRAERAGYIRKRWPSQLSDDIVAYAVEHALSNDDIAGALYMAATKKRSHQAHAQASRNWRPPSTGQKRSLKSKRR